MAQASINQLREQIIKVEEALALVDALEWIADTYDDEQAARRITGSLREQRNKLINRLAKGERQAFQAQQEPTPP